MPLRYLTGRLLYKRKSTDAVRGREDFSITENRDGTVTLAALAMTDDSKFVRHVVYTRAADGRPKDAFVRLQVERDLVGSGYFRVEGDTLHITTDTVMTGHSVQAVKVPTDFFSLVTHSVMLDGWIVLNYDWEVGGLQRRTFYNTSTMWNGTDGPLGRMESYRVSALDDKDVVSPAGVFPCRHVRMEADFLKVPASDIYVTGKHNVLVKYDWNEFDLEYVLETLKEESLGV
jgi:hypothetical protein